jgi:hypothetical protein
VTTPASTPALTFGTPPPQSQASGSLSRPRHNRKNPRRYVSLSPSPSQTTLILKTRRRPTKVLPAAKTHKCSCSGCGYSASSEKDRKRHELEKHNRPGANGILPPRWYACRCPYRSPRKADFFRRHLTSPKCAKQLVRDHYVCQCTTQFIDRDEFTLHATTCGAKSRGRPPKSSSLTAPPVAAAVE